MQRNVCMPTFNLHSVNKMQEVEWVEGEDVPIMSIALVSRIGRAKTNQDHMPPSKFQLFSWTILEVCMGMGTKFCF